MPSSPDSDFSWTQWGPTLFALFLGNIVKESSADLTPLVLTLIESSNTTFTREEQSFVLSYVPFRSVALRSVSFPSLLRI